MKSQPDSETSRRTSASSNSEPADGTTMIQTCIKKHFDPESHLKFQQILEYLGPDLYVPVYLEYNSNLYDQLVFLQTIPLPEGYALGSHVSLKIKFYAFRFISDIGLYILNKLKAGDEKASENFISLMKILLFHALTSKSDTANLALVELERLCRKRGLSLPSLYQNNRPKFLRLIIKAILHKLMSDDKGGNGSNGNGSGKEPSDSYKSSNVYSYLTRAFEVFNVASITREDISQSLIITTNLIHKEIYNDAIKRFLEQLAKQQNIEMSVLIRSHIQAIVVSLLLRRKLSHYDITASLTKMCSFCDRQLNELLATKISFIKGRLILHFSIDSKMVKDGFYFLSKIEKEEHEQPFEDGFDNDLDFIEYIDPSLIGILLGVDSYLNEHRKDIGSKESIDQIRSLVKLTSLLSPLQIQIIHVKFLSTLSLILRLRPRRDNIELNRVIRDLWAVFVSKLKEESKTSLLISISVAMFDLVEDCPEEVASIYEDLLCNRKTSPNLEEKLKSLFFVPNLPGFEKIYKFLTPYVRRNDSVSNLAELQLSLDCALPLMKLENNKCRSIALMKIKQLLKSNRRLLLSNMSTNLDEPIDSLISKIIESLLSYSSMSDQDCLALIAECLGIIGAVNPIRLDHLIFGEIHSRRSLVVRDLSNPDFIVDLIERLKFSLLSDQISESETANYAIQVVVKTYSVFSDPNIKSKLSSEAIRACELCQNTSYSGTKKINSDMSVPVYERFKNEFQYSYIEWLDKFYLNIVSIIKNKKIQDILHACSYIFRFNQKLAEFLLPNTIIHVILNQPSGSLLIVNEIKSILDEDVGVSTQDLDTVYNQEVRGSLQTLHFQCANMVFCAMDALHRLNSDLRSQSDVRAASAGLLESLRQFMAAIPKDKLALLAMKCRSHARALCYFEQYFFNDKNQIDKHATSLQRIYMALDDQYEAAGIEMMRTTPTNLIDDIANYEASGRFDKAFICYCASLEEVKDDKERESFIEDSLKCISNQGDNLRLYEKSRQLLADYPQLKQSILPAAIESCWKLGKWDELHDTLRVENSDSLLESTSVSQGYLLSSLIQDRQDVPDRLKLVRQKLMKPLSIAMMDRSAYFRGYQNLLILHSIEDFAISLDVLEQNQFSTQSLDENTVDIMRPKLLSSLDSLFELWTRRNKLVQPLLRSLEPLAAWQRSITLVLTRKCPFLKQKLDVEIGRIWLCSADTAREARCFDNAFICLTQAQKWFGSEFHKLSVNLQVRFYMEQAKLEWDQGEKTRAIRALKLSLQRFKNHPLIKHINERRCSNNPTDPFPQLSNLHPCNQCGSIDKDDRESFAQLKMLLTHFSEEAAAGIPETLFYMYEECVHLGVNQEETYFRLARYYDRLLAYYMENPKLCAGGSDEKSLSDATQRYSQNLVSGDKEEVYTKLMEHSIIAFGHSLKYGAKYLSESMPRMLNIWYDLGSRNIKSAPRIVGSRTENTVRFIDELRRTLPPYYFMTAISLILSRVCHQHSGISKGTCEILMLLLLNYPYQISWLFMALLNERENKDRRKAANEILNAIRRRSAETDKIIRDTQEFAKLLMEIAINHGPLDKSKTDSKKKKLTGVVNLKDITLAANKFDFEKSKVIPPIQSSIRAIYPTGHGSDNLTKHIAFPEHRRYFLRSFQPKARIFNSLQQPRGIYLDCDNGKAVQILCKAGDDLRKDSRCVEFFNLLNRILRRNSQSNARFFEIPTFLVLPLESFTGVIEMVPNCETLRSIIDALYKERHKNFSCSDILPRRTGNMSLTELHSHYKSVIEKLSPPVLPTWFLRKFTEPTSWYMARLAYTRSTAVISMGGYIIGLGDRHLDNILFDTCSGRVVHVDFNLLFHQGESLPTPECVPFRATHNVVAAFGPMGTEGNFRKVCEITMRVMRKEKDALLTTLKPFMHDPCSEWLKIRDPKERAKPDEENRSAKFKIEIIERKLKGFPRSKKFKPLTLYDSYSVEAQVDNLIEEASDTVNLSQMYFGWCPHI